MPAPETTPVKKAGSWVEPLLWSLVFLAAIIIAAVVNANAREVILQGLGYLFTFFSTPFVLEASVAFVGLSLVFFINGRRIEKEGDGWVVMEVKKEDAETKTPVEEAETKV